MDLTIRNRVLLEAKIFLEKQTTVRGVASMIKTSKSTVHKDFLERLEPIDSVLYEKVLVLLKHNKEVRHLRGGEATKKLYAKNKKIEL